MIYKCIKLSLVCTADNIKEDASTWLVTEMTFSSSETAESRKSFGSYISNGVTEPSLYWIHALIPASWKREKNPAQLQLKLLNSSSRRSKRISITDTFSLHKIERMLSSDISSKDNWHQQRVLAFYWLFPLSSFVPCFILLPRLSLWFLICFLSCFLCLSFFWSC